MLNKNNLESRKKYESLVVTSMIHIFCKRKHSKDYLCKDCEEIIEYCKKRIEHCPLGERKINCKECKIHCYSKEKRQKIIEIMRFAGPKMSYLHPIMAFRHLLRR